MKILKFIGLILFNIVYLYINYYLCAIYYLVIFIGQDVEIPPILKNLDFFSLLFVLILFVWITKFLLFPILLTIGSKIKYIKNLVKIIKDNIIDKKSTLILALLFDCAILLYVAIYSKFSVQDWFYSSVGTFAFLGGGILPVYLSMSLWSFLNKDSI